MHEVTRQSITRDIILAQEIFGATAVIWPSSGTWMRIKGYQLPPYYNRQKTDLLIIFPPHYGLVNVPLQEFYMDKGLKVQTRNAGWKPIPHYYSGDNHNKYCAEQWAWYCIHPKSWDADRDSIMTFLKLIDLMLQDPFRWKT